jgi:membrane protein DedA with SNARE-associated domain/membrane-associated phospholipid phosphatase
MLELIAFPLPGEALMTYCGYIIYQQKMNWGISILVSTLGVGIGITLSYLIGKELGITFFEKHGHYIHMDKNRLDNISRWFDKYGNKLLIIAYFIPGVRHVTGYFSGITKVSYRKFAVNAYLGAFIWTATFISLGKVLGANWEKYHNLLKKYLLIGSLIIAVIIVSIYLYKTYKQKIHDSVIKMLNNSLKIFHSLGKIKVAIAGIAVSFLIFLALMIGVIQDYLAHEFSEFDEISKYIIMNIFDKNWSNIMKSFRSISNIYVLLITIIITAIWIFVKSINKLEEIEFLIISFLGAEAISNILKIAFHRLGPSGTFYTFPSGEGFMTVVTYGFLAYMIIKYSKQTWINYLVLSMYLCINFLIGLSIIYLNLQYPSDIIAGYEFGVVWLSLSIILLEIYRVLPNIRNK